MENGPDNARVNLAIPIPVVLVYGTAVVQEDGEVYFLSGYLWPGCPVGSGVGEGLSISVDLLIT
jgi:hypothetical protein